MTVTRPKTALVTGASRRGAIGAAICRALAADGFDICFSHWGAFDATQISGFDGEGPASIRADIEALGRRAFAMEMDFSQSGAAKRLFDASDAALGNIVVVVNNAAHSTQGDIDRIDEDSLDAHYTINFRTTAMLTAEFARRWPGGLGGRVINFTSGQGVGPMPGELAYASLKGAIEAFTVSAAPTLARRGITINAVDPGATDSGWMTEELKQQFQAESPFGRLGLPTDAARLVAFLASDAAGWITGQIIHSRGGL